jgi:hypothetical protein
MVPGHARFHDQALASAHYTGMTVFSRCDETPAAQKLNDLIGCAGAAGFTHYFFHADDDYLTSRDVMARLVQLAAETSADVTYGLVQAVSEEGRGRGIWTPPGLPHLPGASLIRIGLWRRAGGYPEIPYGADAAMLAIAMRTGPVQTAFLNDVVYCHRQHADTESTRGDRAAFERIMAGGVA